MSEHEDRERAILARMLAIRDAEKHFAETEETRGKRRAKKLMETRQQALKELAAAHLDAGRHYCEDVAHLIDLLDQATDI